MDGMWVCWRRLGRRVRRGQVLLLTNAFSPFSCLLTAPLCACERWPRGRRHAAHWQFINLWAAVMQCSISNVDHLHTSQIDMSIRQLVIKRMLDGFNRAVVTLLSAGRCCKIAWRRKCHKYISYNSAVYFQTEKIKVHQIYEIWKGKHASAELFRDVGSNSSFQSIRSCIELLQHCLAWACKCLSDRFGPCDERNRCTRAHRAMRLIKWR